MGKMSGELWERDCDDGWSGDLFLVVSAGGREYVEGCLGTTVTSADPYAEHDDVLKGFCRDVARVALGEAEGCSGHLWAHGCLIDADEVARTLRDDDGATLVARVDARGIEVTREGWDVPWSLETPAGRAAFALQRAAVRIGVRLERQITNDDWEECCREGAWESREDLERGVVQEACAMMGGALGMSGAASREVGRHCVVDTMAGPAECFADVWQVCQAADLHGPEEQGICQASPAREVGPVTQERQAWQSHGADL